MLSKTPDTAAPMVASAAGFGRRDSYAGRGGAAGAAGVLLVPDFSFRVLVSALPCSSVVLPAVAGLRGPKQEKREDMASGWCDVCVSLGGLVGSSCGLLLSTTREDGKGGSMLSFVNRAGLSCCCALQCDQSSTRVREKRIKKEKTALGSAHVFQCGQEKRIAQLSRGVPASPRRHLLCSAPSKGGHGPAPPLPR